MNKSYHNIISFLFLLFFAMWFPPVEAQVYNIDPYLRESKSFNTDILTNYGYTLSLFLNSFEGSRGNLLPGVRWGVIGKRTYVLIDKDNREGMLSGKSSYYLDMMGFAMALTPRINASAVFHNGTTGGTDRQPVLWQGNIKYDLVGSYSSLNRILISVGYGETKYVKDFYFNHYTIEGVYNGRSDKAGYTIGVGVNHYIFKIHPDGDTPLQYYPDKIIKNLFKFDIGLQFNFQEHWQFMASYTKAYFSSYQFDIVFYL